jgi:hypothetical protein
MPRQYQHNVSFQAPQEDEESYDTNSPNSDRQVYKERNQRRQRSSSLAQSQQIRDIIAKTVEELSGEQFTGSWEERLQNALADAKESGYSSERIFVILGKRPEEGDLIPKQRFVEGLRRLGLKWKDDEELRLITDRFGMDGDNTISSSKVQHYCYHEVPSVAWKAERQRLEAAETVDDYDAAEDGSRFDLKEVMCRVGPEILATSKIFWRQKICVNITLRYCKDLDVITMQLQNAETGEEYETLYLRKSDCVADQGALEEEGTDAMQPSNDKAILEVYSSFLIAHLHLEEIGGSYRPRLGNLRGDKTSSLGIEKPVNLIAPKRSECQSAAPRRISSIDSEFNSTMKTFEINSRSARASRQSAQEMSRLVESALKEILDEDFTNTMSK